MAQINLIDKYPSAFPNFTTETGFKCHVITKGDATGNEPVIIMVNGSNEFTGDLANLSDRY